MLQGLVENEGDGWQWTLDELSRYYESVATNPAPHDTGKLPSFLDAQERPAETEAYKLAREHAGLYLDAAALLGRRTAEMHLALATPTDDSAFLAEPFSPSDLEADATRIDAQIVRTLDALKRGMSQLPDDATVDSAALLLSRRINLFARANVITAATPGSSGQRIRIHGDYHLGQVLRSRSDYVILDFEGEPARPLSERRAKQSPLKDVAGMLRSFSYAAYAGLHAFTQRRPPNNEADAHNLEAWTRLWQNTISTEFLHAYRQSIGANPNLVPQAPQAHILLNAYLLEKALYELLYELNNRPTWVRIPLAGILALPDERNMP
jgi:maltose alpha-D-glucosyltransferase/alpha-amylase